MRTRGIAKSKLLKSWWRDKGAVAGSFLMVMFGVMAVFAPVIAPQDPYAQDLSSALLPPVWQAGGSGKYLLGTDAVGRDVLSNIIWGTRVSFTVGVGATVIALVVGVAAGVCAGYYGGRLDSVLMRVVDIQLAIPEILVALAVMAVLGRGVFLLTVVIGLTTWTTYARTSRGSTLVVKQTEYVEAARAVGVPDLAILLRHVLPNILTPIAILVAVQLPRVIMLESTLSFLGVGVPVTTPSLGIMISRGFRVLFSGAWWVTMFPGLVLMLSVLGINLLGDWLRDALDPRFQTGGGQG